MTECEGEVGTLGAIQLDTPSPALILDICRVVSEDSGGNILIRVSRVIQKSLAKITKGLQDEMGSLR